MTSHAVMWLAGGSRTNTSDTTAAAAPNWHLKVKEKLLKITGKAGSFSVFVGVVNRGS